MNSYCYFAYNIRIMYNKNSNNMRNLFIFNTYTYYIHTYVYSNHQGYKIIIVCVKVKIKGFIFLFFYFSKSIKITNFFYGVHCIGRCADYPGWESMYVHIIKGWFSYLYFYNTIHIHNTHLHKDLFLQIYCTFSHHLLLIIR